MGFEIISLNSQDLFSEFKLGCTSPFILHVRNDGCTLPCLCLVGRSHLHVCGRFLSENILDYEARSELKDSMKREMCVTRKAGISCGLFDGF